MKLKDEIKKELMERLTNPNLSGPDIYDAIDLTLEKVEEIIEELRLKYRKVGSIKEQDFAEELKQKIKDGE